MIICSFSLLMVARWSTDCSGWFLGLVLSLLGQFKREYPQVSVIFWSIFLDFHLIWKSLRVFNHFICHKMYSTCYCLIWCNITFDCYDIDRKLTSPLPQKFLKNESCIKCRFNVQIKKSLSSTVNCQPQVVFLLRLLHLSVVCFFF